MDNALIRIPPSIDLKNALLILQKEVPSLEPRLIEKAFADRNIAKPEDVFDRSYVKNENMLPKDISALLFGLKSYLPPPSTTTTIFSVERKFLLPYRFVAEYGKTEKQDIRIVFKNNASQEIIAGEFTDSGLSRITFGGFSPQEWLSFGIEKSTQLLSLIHNASTYELVKSSLHAYEANPKVAAKLKVLASNLHFFQELTGRRKFAISSHAEAPVCTTNGCTSSPDFNFKECCDAHDIAYCKGGTENDRKKADIELYECIKKKANTWIAWIYYQAVRKFGASHFNYRYNIVVVPSTPVPGNVGIPVTPDPAKRCQVTVTLIRVEYRGDDIGNDWSWKFAIEGRQIKRGEHKLSPGESDTVGTIVFDTIGWTCGGNVLLDVYASAKEHDLGPDDKGSVSKNDLVFKCENKKIRLQLTCPVSEWSEGTAEIVFHYDVELKCLPTANL